MTDNEINQTIAEACGGADFETEEHPAITYHWCVLDGVRRIVPDYCHDLNAMHDAEEALKTGEPQRFVFALMEMLGAFAPSLGDDYQLIHATARHRAEAFLRTVGKWS